MSDIDPWDEAAGTQPTTATPAPVRNPRTGVTAGGLDPWEAAAVDTGSEPSGEDGGGLTDYIPGSLRRGYNRFEQGINVAGYELGILDEEEFIANLISNQADIADAPAPPEVVAGQQEILNSEGVLDTLYNIVTNPGASASFFGESAPLMGVPVASTALGAAAGSVVPGAGTLAGAAVGAGAGSGATEYAISVVDGLSKMGLDINDPNALRAALNDPEVMSAIREDAALRGAIIGAVDAATLGASSRIVGPALRTGSTASRVGRGAAATGVEALGGSAGEAGAQLATEGEINTPEVVLEGALEIVPGTAEAIIGGLSQRGQTDQPVEGEVVTDAEGQVDPWDAAAVPSEQAPVQTSDGEVVTVEGAAPIVEGVPEVPVPPSGVLPDEVQVSTPQEPTTPTVGAAAPVTQQQPPPDQPPVELQPVTQQQPPPETAPIEGAPQQPVVQPQTPQQAAPVPQQQQQAPQPQQAAQARPRAPLSRAEGTIKRRAPEATTNWTGQVPADSQPLLRQVRDTYSDGTGAQVWDRQDGFQVRFARAGNAGGTVVSGRDYVYDIVDPDGNAVDLPALEDGVTISDSLSQLREELSPSGQLRRRIENRIADHISTYGPQQAAAQAPVAAEAVSAEETSDVSTPASTAQQSVQPVQATEQVEPAAPVSDLPPGEPVPEGQTETEAQAQPSEPLFTQPVETESETSAQEVAASDEVSLADREASAAPAVAEEAQNRRVVPKRRGRKTVDVEPSTIKLEPSFSESSQTFRQSVYRDAFRDAGFDVDEAENFSVARQIQIVKKHVEDKYGLTILLTPDEAKKWSVNRMSELDGITPEDRNSVLARLDRIKPAYTRETLDQLLDAYRNLQWMSSSLGVPQKGLSLGGDYAIVFERPTGVYYGAFMPMPGIIFMPGRTNSFAHEFAHALDNKLGQDLLGTAAGAYFSKYSANQGKDAPLPGSPAEAFAKLLTTMFYDDAELAARVLDLERQATLTTREGRPTKKALKAQEELQQIMAGNSNLAVMMSEYLQNSTDYDNDTGMRYYQTAHEMFARAFEAYTSARITENGGTTEFVSKEDEAYLSEADDRFAATYPKEEERDLIFEAMDELMERVVAEDILGIGTAAVQPSDGVVVGAKHVRDLRAPTRNGLSAELREFKQDLKNSASAVAAGARDVGAAITAPRETWNKFSDRQDQNALSLKDTIKTQAAVFLYAQEAVLNMIIKRSTDGENRRSMEGANAVRQLRDKLKKFETQWGTRSKRAISKFDTILNNSGLLDRLGRLPAEQNTQLRDALLGDPPANDTIKKAAADIRRMLNDSWYRLRDVGFQVGYTAENYLPRVMRFDKIFQDPITFLKRAGDTYKDGMNIETGGSVTDVASFEKMYELVRGHYAYWDENKSQVAARNPNVNTVKHDETVTKLKKSRRDVTKALKLEASERDAALNKIWDDFGDGLYNDALSFFADLSADRYYAAIRLGGTDEAVTIGGLRSDFLQKRVLPASADRHLEEFLETDLSASLPAYFENTERKVAYNENFWGKDKNGQWVENGALNTLRKTMDDGGVATADIKLANEIFDNVVIGARSNFPTPMTRVLNAISSWGSMLLMGRVAFSSVPEAMVAGMKTGDVRNAYVNLSQAYGDWIVNRPRKEAMQEFARHIGAITAPMHDTALMNRVSGDLDPSQKMQQRMTRFFYLTGLTTLTNAQRRVSTGIGYSYLKQVAETYMTETGAAKEAAQDELLNAGIGVRDLDAMAAYIIDQPAEPSIEALDVTTPEGDAFANAIATFTDKTIQNPRRLDRPFLAFNPMGRLLFGLMSFSYAFFKNITIDVLYERTIKGTLTGKTSPYDAVNVVGTLAGLYLLTALTTIVRQSLFSPAPDEDDPERYDVSQWTSDQWLDIFGRTGVTGPFDVPFQIMTGLKYQRDVTSLTAGAQLGFVLQQLQSVMGLASDINSPNTNTQEHKATQAVYQTVGNTALIWGLTSLPPISKLGTALAGSGIMFGTSYGASDAAATAVVGERGTRTNNSGGSGL